MLDKLSARLIWLLPLLFIAPEVLKVGGVFIRWDYLLLPIGALLLYRKVALERAWQNSFSYHAGAFFMGGAFLAFTAYQISVSSLSGAEAAEAVKYALWPVKIFIWAALMREVVVATGEPTQTLYRLFSTLVLLVLGVQAAELASSAVRDFLFQYYPVQAENRLHDLSYRARAIFNGYDTASMFFCLSALVLDKLTPKGAPGRYAVEHGLLMLVCLAGAFLAARTGFLLLLAYLAWQGWYKSSSLTRLTAVVALLTMALGIITLLPSSVSGEEGSLGGRYLEILAIFRSGGDPRAVNSFFGTLYMNYAVFFLNSWNPLWGNGLETTTTADQLYAKYLYMFGIVGLATWITTHIGLIFALWRRTRATKAPLAQAGLAYLVLIGLAHAKGGNYLFAQRLGELGVLVLLLGMTRFSKQSKEADRAK